MSSGVVGRDAELAALHGFLASIPAGTVALVLEGDAGVGKTTLWEAGVEEAGGKGFRVLAARPAESESALSFSGIGDLLDQVLDEALAPLSAAQHRALSRALVLGDDEGPPPDPHAIGVALLNALRALGEELPVVVAVDDVQWLDPASAGGLAYATRRLRSERIGVLLSRRSGLESVLLTELRRAFPSGRMTSVGVGPLDAGALSVILRSNLGVILPKALLDEVRVVSGGNPFYALEIVRTMQRSDVPVEAGQMLSVPESLHDLVHRRLIALPPETRDFLLAAAAHAQPTVDVAEAASGIGRETLRPALAAHVVEVDGGRIRFAHPLLAAGAYDIADRSRRAEIHARLAELLDDPEARAWQLSASVGSPDEGVARALEDGARHASHRGAPRSAALMLDRASELTVPRHGEAAVRRAIDAAFLHFASGDSRRAEVQIRDVVAALPPGPMRARAGVVLARIRLYEAPGEAAELFAQVLEEADTGDRRTLALAHEGVAACSLWLFERFDAALEHSEAALALADEVGDEALIADVLMTRLSAEALLGRSTAAATAERAEALQAATSAGRVLDQPIASVVEYWTWIDSHERAREALVDLIQSAHDMGDENAPPWLLFLLGHVERLLGTLETALEHAREGREASEQSGQQVFARLNLALEALGVRGARQGRARAGGCTLRARDDP